MLGALVARQIEPHIPAWDKSRRDDGSASRDDFSYDRARDVYICPGGKSLKTTGRAHDGETLLYRAGKLDCDAGLLKPRCGPKTPARKVPRDVTQEARDHARSLIGSEAYLHCARQRKKVERPFGEVKTNLALTRLRPRGLTGARDEFLPAATVQNLKRLARYLTGPPPTPAIA